MKTHLIIHDPQDCVGVVVTEKVQPNEQLNAWVMDNDETVRVEAKNEVLLGHKVALKDLDVGDTIIKYGNDIGKVVQKIRKGEHVHVHNVKTKRW